MQRAYCSTAARISIQDLITVTQRLHYCDIVCGGLSRATAPSWTSHREPNPPGGSIRIRVAPQGAALWRGAAQTSGRVGVVRNVERGQRRREPAGRVVLRRRRRRAGHGVDRGNIGWQPERGLVAVDDRQLVAVDSKAGLSRAPLRAVEIDGRLACRVGRDGRPRAARSRPASGMPCSCQSDMAASKRATSVFIIVEPRLTLWIG
jgi:hypothetical protein